MTSMLKAIQKGQKKAAKSKKRKKRVYNSSSDSDSEQEFQSGDTGLSRDEHLKSDKPNGVNLLSTATRPIKVTKLAHNDPEGLRQSYCISSGNDCIAQKDIKQHNAKLRKIRICTKFEEISTK